MDKRGFIRTLEAVLAVILVFVFIYYTGGGSDRDYRTVESIKSLQESILSEISKNDEFRECIVATPVEYFNEVAVKGKNPLEEKNNFCVVDIVNFIKESLPPRFLKNYKFNVCDINSCSLPYLGKEGKVYTSAVIITSSVKGGGYNPRILRLWLR